MKINRRTLLQGAGLTTLSLLSPSLLSAQKSGDKILVVVELSGGNDGLNSFVPYGDDAYYKHRPTIGIDASDLLKIDDHFGLNPGMLGLHRLWQDGQVAVVHGCGYEQPSYSHFTSMAYWHTGVPHRGDEFGWLGRVADQLNPQYRDNMLINVANRQSLAVKSKVHTPVVFDDPERFQRHAWMDANQETESSPEHAHNKNHAFLRSVDQSAQASSVLIRNAWTKYSTDVDYGIAPMDLPKVAACISAGLPTQLYHVSFRNNSFDTHVQQPALHRRLLSYACDGLHGFVRDLERLGLSDRVAILVYSEFGRRVPENANLGTDHGSANDMWVIGAGVDGGHYGELPSLTNLVDGDNLAHTADFRQVYATMVQDWLKADASSVLHGEFATLPLFI
ncbi:MAG: DUF1501 domain-containing protein [Pseudomonadales bacterium]|nr:DUF1501 domain-containing protein [Pseudomonadales bacterium]